MTKLPTIDDMLKSKLLVRGDDKSLLIRRLPLGIPALDKAIGGGLPRGRVTLLYGNESTGKTLLAQYAAAAQQREASRKQVLLMDIERSYDANWWAMSGVDSELLYVSVPPTAEAAIDVMRALLAASKDIGMVIVDSLAAMTPSYESDANTSSDMNSIGLQARLIGRMFRTVIPLLKDTILVCINQMRETIGQHEDLAGLPGGRVQRHDSHLILRTRREAWLTDNKAQRIGYSMEITPRKNKTAPMAPAVTLPFLFHSQIDLLTSYLDQAIAAGIIVSRVPYYGYGELKFLGKANLRTHFTDNPDELARLTAALEESGWQRKEQPSTDTSSDG